MSLFVVLLRAEETLCHRNKAPWGKKA